MRIILILLSVDENHLFQPFDYAVLKTFNKTPNKKIDNQSIEKISSSLNIKEDISLY